MFYISFHGGSGSSAYNNIHIYQDDGSVASPDKLLTAGSTQLSELRSFAFLPNGLFVVNGYKKYSQLLQYTLQGGNWQFNAEWAGPSINSIDHPFDFVFDTAGNCYLSSQDTGVVTILSAAGTAGNVPATLLQGGASASDYLLGTFVACEDNAIAEIKVNPRYGIAQPLGLGVLLDKGKVSHSVRGLAYYNQSLFVADEAAGMVKVYAVSDGSLQAAIAGLSSPVHLLIQGSRLYISTDDGVMQATIPSSISFNTPMIALPYIDKAMMKTANAKSLAGMCFGPNPSKPSDTAMFVADRKGKAVYYRGHKGTSIKPFITGLSDNPEFIRYMP